MTEKHFSEADLLETYYMRPDQSAPIMKHLASCDQCIDRFNRLERKLRDASAAACPTKPATFWAFQRSSIMRRVDAARAGTSRAPRLMRVAAAAAFSFFLGGALVYETVRPEVKVVEMQASAPVAATAPDSVDPWQSEELKDFHAVVQWESWVAEGNS